MNEMTDEDYITKHYPTATEAQKEDLAERIAIMVIDGCVEEQKAREWALFGKYED